MLALNFFSNFQNNVSFPPPFTAVFTINPNQRVSLRKEEGQQIFILNTTAWAYFAGQYPEKAIEKGKNQGVNVIWVCQEGKPNFDKVGYD